MPGVFGALSKYMTPPQEPRLMSRSVLLIVACALAVMVWAPSAAFATGGGSSSAHAKHKASHKSARHRQRRRHAAAVDNSGSVMSFDGKVLTVKRANGSTMRGRVDDATQMSCETEQEFETQHAAATAHRRRGRGATAKAARNGGPSSSSTEPNHSENENEVENENEMENEAEHAAGDDQSAAACGMADVKPGSKVDVKLVAGSKSLLAAVRLVK